MWEALPATAQAPQVAGRVERLLTKSPVIDAHNDLLWELRDRYGSDLAKIDLQSDTSRLPPTPGVPVDLPPLMTDLPRLRAGHVGGQFWSVWIPGSVTGPAAVKMTLEQIDLAKRMVQRYPEHLGMAYTADDIERAGKAGRIASLLGIEGGHQIDNSLPMLRQLYALGARYLTLTHTSNNAWADAGTDNPVHKGLSPFGLAVIQEMNRLGMVVDLSHVSRATMLAALSASQAPVMFSHSNARALVDHPRGVDDEVLALVAKNRGIVMVNFNPGYVSQAVATYEAALAAEQRRYNAPPYAGLYIGQPERAAAALEEWKRNNPAPRATLAMVADHMDHIRKVAGADSVGIGGDLDGINDTPDGLDGVDKYPRLFDELARRGWSDADLAKAARGNILRVLRRNEEVARQLQAKPAPPDAVFTP
ncbi:membrane dipeptidase [Massilia yuzhufengensis]|uniref:Membrane dipeptidase n=2 Tax=Massilia yuzhufengensis TaxID=1164594 RepID=A0A1I1RPM4_9BURK|nr:membrane dipeptidase [Massilia yuzhufengensis]